MRYPDGGGLSAAGRVRREKVRLQAAEWFAEGVEPPEVACYRTLRMSMLASFKLAFARAWKTPPGGGRAGFGSRGGGVMVSLSLPPR
jgi:hypothetical protein